MSCVLHRRDPALGVPVPRVDWTSGAQCTDSSGPHHKTTLPTDFADPLPTRQPFGAQKAGLHSSGGTSPLPIGPMTSSTPLPLLMPRVAPVAGPRLSGWVGGLEGGVREYRSTAAPCRRTGPPPTRLAPATDDGRELGGGGDAGHSCAAGPGECARGQTHGYSRTRTAAHGCGPSLMTRPLCTGAMNRPYTHTHAPAPTAPTCGASHPCPQRPALGQSPVENQLKRAFLLLSSR